MTLLGVDRALVEGEWVTGDVAVADDGVVSMVGVEGGPVRGLSAVPGFVDLQVNGAGGIDLRGATPLEMIEVAELLAATGTAAFQPTCYSAPIEVYESFLGSVGEARSIQDRGDGGGARVLPAHLEGPFLNPRWSGAHDRTQLLEPSVAVVERLLHAGPVGLVTLAPELPGASDLIGHLAQAGVVVSIGHSDATAVEAREAVVRGATMLTHGYNAHRRMTSRDPGPLGVALTDDRLSIGVICDLVHVAPEMVLLAFRAAADRIAVVTDAVAPSGTDMTSWAIDGVEVAVSDGRATLADGTLAGAVVTMDQMVRNLIEIGVPEVVALTAASTTPARVIGYGRHDLTPGCSADIAVIDERCRVERILTGRSRFGRLNG